MNDLIKVSSYEFIVISGCLIFLNRTQQSLTRYESGQTPWFTKKQSVFVVAFYFFCQMASDSTFLDIDKLSDGMMNKKIKDD